MIDKPLYAPCQKDIECQNLDQTVLSFDSFVVHEQTKIVFAQIGYTVKEKE